MPRRQQVQRKPKHRVVRRAVVPVEPIARNGARDELLMRVERTLARLRQAG
jgi:hypothetical protein